MMIPSPIHWIRLEPAALELLKCDVAPGVYLHALEVAVWLRDNGVDELADALERDFAGMGPA